MSHDGSSVELEKLIPRSLYEQMERNHKLNMSSEPEPGSIDFKPVVKLLITVGGNATWLLTEIDEQGIAFGLCDLGQGFPELGYVDLQSLSKDFGDRLERDLHFRSTEKLSAYVNYARQKRMIITHLPSNYKQ